MTDKEFEDYLNSIPDVGEEPTKELKIGIAQNRKKHGDAWMEDILKGVWEDGE